MRQDVITSVLIFSAVKFLDAHTLPSDFNPTNEDLQFVDLSNMQNNPLPCSAGESNSNTVSKRQTTNCVGVDCADYGTSDNVAPESPADNQPFGSDDLTHNPEGPLELAINQNSGSQDNLFGDGNKNWNNALANVPLNDATTNILSSAPNGQNTLGQAETDVSDGVADGALSDGFEIAAKPKSPAHIIDQDPKTGEPSETSCLVPPEDQPNAYLVHLIAFKVSSHYTPWRNPEAILVTQYRTGLKYKYDIHVLPGTGSHREMGFRKVTNYSLLSKGKPVPLARYEPRGWLVSWPENDALEWFEALARSVSLPNYGLVNAPGQHVTALWVARVFEALAGSDSQYWIPITL